MAQVLISAKELSALGKFARTSTGGPTELNRYSLGLNIPSFSNESFKEVPQKWLPGQRVDFKVSKAGRINALRLAFQWNMNLYKQIFPNGQNPLNLNWYPYDIHGSYDVSFGFPGTIMNDPSYFLFDKIEFIIDGVVFTTVFPEDFMERILATHVKGANSTSYLDVKNPNAFNMFNSNRPYSSTQMATMECPVLLIQDVNNGGTASNAVYNNYIDIPAYFLERIADQLDSRELADWTVRVHCRRNWQSLAQGQAQNFFDTSGLSQQTDEFQRNAWLGLTSGGFSTNTSALLMSLETEHIIPNKRSYAQLMKEAMSYGDLGQRREAYDSIVVTYPIPNFEDAFPNPSWNTPGIVGENSRHLDNEPLNVWYTDIEVPLVYGSALIASMLYVAPTQSKFQQNVATGLNTFGGGAYSNANHFIPYPLSNLGNAMMTVPGGGLDYGDLLFPTILKSFDTIPGITQVTLMLDGVACLTWNKRQMLMQATDNGYTMNDFKNAWVLSWKHTAGPLVFQQGLQSTQASSNPKLLVRWDYAVNVQYNAQSDDKGDAIEEPYHEIMYINSNGKITFPVNNVATDFFQNATPMELRVLHKFNTSVSISPVDNTVSRRVLS